MENEKRAADATPHEYIAKVVNYSDNIKPKAKKQLADGEVLGFCEWAKTKPQGVSVTPDGFVSADVLLSMPQTKIPTLYDPIFPKVGVVILGGESDAGKSMFLRNMAICAATGRDFLDMPYKGEHQSAIYAATEDNDIATSVMLKTHNKYYHDSPDKVKNLFFTFVDEDIVSRLESRLKNHPADLIIFDSLSDFFGGKDMNSSAQVRPFMRPFIKLANDYKCLIVFLHHIGKRQEKLTPSKNALVGSQSLEAQVRAVYMLYRDKDDPELRHLVVAKHNYLGAEYKVESIELRMSTDTFTFSPTGNRIPIQYLGEVAERPKSKSVGDYGNDDDFLQYFSDTIGNGSIAKTSLCSSIKKVFQCNQDNAQKIINHYVEKGWLKDVSLRTDRVSYKLIYPYTR